MERGSSLHPTVNPRGLGDASRLGQEERDEDQAGWAVRTLVSTVTVPRFGVTLEANLWMHLRISREDLFAKYE